MRDKPQLGRLNQPEFFSLPYPNTAPQRSNPACPVPFVAMVRALKTHSVEPRVRICMVAVVLAAALLPACLGIGWDCGSSAGVASLDLKMAPGPRPRAGWESYAVPVTEEFAVSLADPRCSAPEAGYRWWLVQGGEYGGFPPITFTSTGLEHMFALDFPGEYWLRVHIASPLIDLYAFLILNEELPSDGSSFRESFTTFCCPCATYLRVLEVEPGIIGQSWLKRLVLERTGEILVETRAEDFIFPCDVLQENLGTQWLEELTIELVPDSPADPVLAGRHAVDIRIAPARFDGYDDI
jgi:hypothetical protein